MTVSATENRFNPYVADAIEDTFEIRFKWYEIDEVMVYVNKILLATQVGYSVVTTAVDPDMSNDADVEAFVVFDTPPADTLTVDLKQRINITQETDYLAFGKFSADSHEKALDKLTLLRLGEAVTKVATSSPAHPTWAALTGVVDGANPIYTLPDEIYDISTDNIEVWYRGALQYDFTIVGNVITLGFAPKASNGNEVTIRYETI